MDKITWIFYFYFYLNKINKFINIKEGIYEIIQTSEKGEMKEIILHIINSLIMRDDYSYLDRVLNLINSEELNNLKNYNISKSIPENHYIGFLNFKEDKDKKKLPEARVIYKDIKKIDIKNIIMEKLCEEESYVTMMIDYYLKVDDLENFFYFLNIHMRDFSQNIDFYYVVTNYFLKYEDKHEKFEYIIFIFYKILKNNYFMDHLITFDSANFDYDKFLIEYRKICEKIDNNEGLELTERLEFIEGKKKEKKEKIKKIKKITKNENILKNEKILLKFIKNLKDDIRLQSFDELQKIDKPLVYVGNTQFQKRLLIIHDILEYIYSLQIDKLKFVYFNLFNKINFEHTDEILKFQYRYHNILSIVFRIYIILEQTSEIMKKFMELIKMEFKIKNYIFKIVLNYFMYKQDHENFRIIFDCLSEGFYSIYLFNQSFYNRLFNFFIFHFINEVNILFKYLKKKSTFDEKDKKFQMLYKKYIKHKYSHKIIHSSNKSSNNFEIFF
jgi:hypothetical protein